ncbi:hypothetical protein JCM10212_005499 [Sporobolomyces blumeae]
MPYPPPPSDPTHFSPSAAIPRNPPRRRLHPYLGPRARLSLSWLSQHFLALLLVLVALGFLLASIPTLVKDGKATLTAACSGVEGAAGVAVSLPHYMADGVNELNSKTISAVTNGAGTVLDLTLQALEAIILFMIDTYRSLFLCLLDLAVHGSLTLLINAIEEAQEFVTNALSTIRTDIQSAIGGINTGLEKTIGLIDKIPGVDIDTPSIDIPDLSALENVTLPSTIVDALTELNSSIPTLDEFRASMNQLISTPIELLRTNINATLSNRSIEVETLPVPAKQTVEICRGLDTSWIDDVGHDLAKFVKIAMSLVVLLMVLFILACAIWERYSYRNFIGGVMSAREAWLNDLLDKSTSTAHPSSASEALSKPKLLSFLNASSHPTLFSFVSRLQKILSVRSSNAKANLIWFLSYIAHPHAWAFLALGVVGLLVVQVQLWALRGPVKDLMTKRANEGAGEFSDSVVASINAKMSESSYEYANRTNKVILSVQDGINDDLFGWVNGTTEALNTTVVGFYDGLTDAITDVFDGTVLEDPILNLVYCLVGSKVDAISTALTWMHAHAHLSLPLVSPTILMLSDNRSQELTSGMTSPDSAVSTTSIVERMLNSYERSLEQQRTGFFVAIGIWALVVVMGVVGLVWRSRGQDRWDRWRGRVERDRNGDDRCEKAGFDDDDEEKPSRRLFKPFHLRGGSNVITHVERPRSPSSRSPVDVPTLQHLAEYTFPQPPPRERAAEAPQAEIDSDVAVAPRLEPSAASWASLVDFFRPTPDEPDSTPPPPSLKKRLALGSLPSVSRATLPRALRRPTIKNPFPPPGHPPSRFKPKPLTISRPRPSSRFRRASDLVDLRTGENVSRNVPSSSATSGTLVGRVRGIGEDIVSRVKAKATSSSGGVERGEDVSASRGRGAGAGGGAEGWAELEPTESRSDARKGTRPCGMDDPSARFSYLPYLPPPVQPTSRANDPFSDPPTPSRSVPAGPGRDDADPFSDVAHRVSAPRETNPFATPFDDDDDERR